jgi:diguanylate cyclase (GGDEF)-like protein
MSDHELLSLRDDADDQTLLEDAAQAWRILIVDDEEQVHRVTRFALEGARILGRSLTFESAYSAEEARQLLARGRYSCILLDVVMESEDAGLKLVGEIRERFEDPAVRIVLRTGQPGHAPEIEVIQHYDINDYRAKSELTSQRLLTTLTSALRSFQQIRTIEANREGLRMILDAASSLMEVKAVRSFADGVLTQICAMLHVKADGLLCAQERGDAGAELRVLAATGRFADRIGEPLGSLGQAELVERMQRVLESEHNEFGRDHAVLFIRSPRAERLVVHVATESPIPELERKLLELFSINIAIGLDNAQLFEELETMAFRDTLTSVWNRASLERELLRRCQLGEPFALALADIDNFQAVNDGLGHEVGDRTLRASAELLAEVFGPEAFLARTAADNFAVVVADEAGDGMALTARLQALALRLQRNLAVDGHEIALTMTLGVARYPSQGHSASSLFRNAGIALKQGKRLNRSSHQYFDDRFERELQARLDTVRELRSAIEHSAFALVYQPQVDMRSGALLGVEALLRWKRRSGWVTPDQFIPAAEESGQILAIGEWVLAEACRQQVQWQRHSGRRLQMAVNVSPRQLKDPGFPAMVERVMQSSGIEPDCLELEITESLLLAEGERALETLAALRRSGIGIAIDDFGTGHSSLSRLQRLPIDRLKIDRSFVTGLVERPEDRIIAAMIINMGHLLGLKVIAEGVETQAQAERLREMDCDQAQGYLFGRPLAAEDIDLSGAG